MTRLMNWLGQLCTLKRTTFSSLQLNYFSYSEKISIWSSSNEQMNEWTDQSTQYEFCTRERHFFLKNKGNHFNTATLSFKKMLKYQLHRNLNIKPSRRLGIIKIIKRALWCQNIVFPSELQSIFSLKKNHSIFLYYKQWMSNCLVHFHTKNQC